MEILVHNISHSDLIIEISLYNINNKNETDVLNLNNIKEIISSLARPRFSLFLPTSQRIMDGIKNLLLKDSNNNNCNPNNKIDSSLIALHEREMNDPYYAFKAHCTETMYPVGFNLKDSLINIPINELLDSFHFKDSESIINTLNKNKLRNNVNHTNNNKQNQIKAYITAVYFPLLAVLIPKWEISLIEHYSSDCSRIFYLISGAGIPRNASHELAGNSTEITAKIMEFFINQYYPEIKVHLIHSEANIFRYDDNVTFMNEKLRPSLESHRQPIVLRTKDAWKSHFHVTIAYADGTPARLSALNASLRIYRPSYLHFWQLKTFWHEKKISLEDADFHSFRNIETSPAININSIKSSDSLAKLLVENMKKFRDIFQESTKNSENELFHFWLRKSKKPVLAVILTQKDDNPNDMKIFRGMNMEVSMPTGSLCAERNAIGSALANDPTLKRHEIKMIGVLAVDFVQISSNVTKDATLVNVEEKKLGENKTISKNQIAKRPRIYSYEENISKDTYTDLKDKLKFADRNPLPPCGSCKEWLLKIAESNPNLQVITFADTLCENIYMHQLI